MHQQGAPVASSRSMAAAACVAASACLVMVVAGGCDRTPSVTVYASADESVARPVFERFEKETGIRVDAKFDTEATKTTGLAQTLRAERDRPRADVFWSNEQAAHVSLAMDGITAPMVDSGVAGAATKGTSDGAPSSPATQWPAAWRDADGRWFALAGRARVIVYAPDRVSAPPTEWTGLIAPRWDGKIAMADPRFGTTRSHLGAMKAYWDTYAIDGYYEAFIEGLAENHPKVLTSGNAGVVDAVARGEADIGLTDSDDVFAAQARGLKVAMVLPRHAHDSQKAGGGTYFIPNTVGILNGAPHPTSARRFVEFMLSPETERQLAAMPSKHAPLVHAAAENDFVVVDPLLIDPRLVAVSADEAVESFFAAMRAVEETK